MYQTLISASDLNAMLEQPNLVIIDCRFSLADQEEGRRTYQTAHIPNAQYAHLDKDLSGEIVKGKTGRHPFPSINKISERLSNWGVDATKQVVIYDQGHGGIAARLWFMLKWLGHDAAAVLNGGWQYWTKQNCPTTAIIPTIQPTVFEAKPCPELVVDVQFMERNINNEKIIYIDSRAAKRYKGEEEPIDPVAGHIPGAISAPFAENLNEEGLFLGEAALKDRFVGLLGKKTNEQAIFYCGSGVTACHNLLALHHIGVTTPRLYGGSWSEWIVNPSRNIEKG